MYATSGAVRWVLSGTYCQPPWKTASSVWNSSAEFAVSVATGSNGRTPRRTQRVDHAVGTGEQLAGGPRTLFGVDERDTCAGSSRAAAQNPLGCSCT